MRRSVVTSVILACVLSVWSASAAAAHPGITVFTIQVGAPTSISILVPADYGKPISEVDVANATGFQLQAGEPPAGWEVARRGDTVVFSGGLIGTDNGFAVFAIRGVAPAKGELLFPITTHSPDGTVMRYTGQPGTRDQAAIVYAGSGPHVPSKAGFPWKPVAGGTLIAIGAVGTEVLARRRRRAAKIDAEPAPRGRRRPRGNRLPEPSTTRSADR